jgi:hypothetical protein
MQRLVARKHTVEGAREGECELVDDIVGPVVAERVRYLPTSLYIHIQQPANLSRFTYTYLPTSLDSHTELSIDSHTERVG